MPVTHNYQCSAVKSATQMQCQARDSMPETALYSSSSRGASSTTKSEGLVPTSADRFGGASQDQHKGWPWYCTVLSALHLVFNAIQLWRRPTKLVMGRKSKLKAAAQATPLYMYLGKARCKAIAPIVPAEVTWLITLHQKPPSPAKPILPCHTSQTLW